MYSVDQDICEDEYLRIYKEDDNANSSALNQVSSIKLLKD